MTTHGGARPGAGRPPLPPGECLIPVTFRIPAQYIPELNALGNGNLSEGLRILIQDYHTLLNYQAGHKADR